MNRLKTYIEHKMWLEEAESSHYTCRERKQLGLRTQEDIRRERAQFILGSNRKPVEISRTVFTYWRNRPLKSDFVTREVGAK